MAPIHVRSLTRATNLQNKVFLEGENFLFIFSFFIVITPKIKMEHSIATTPPNLEGMDRRMAYANKKYHSGRIWTGVVDVLAVLKFSTSPSAFGAIITMCPMVNAITNSGRVSFTMKYGKNFILSLLGFVPVGFDDPGLWRAMRWISARTTVNRGIRKCSDRNRFRVGCDTEVPPQIHSIRSFPM